MSESPTDLACTVLQFWCEELSHEQHWKKNPTLDRHIAELRNQQRSIVAILKLKTLQGGEMISKERWVAIMRAAGFSEKDMHNWHLQFEKMEPEAHQEFLESLGIDPAEIARIREYSRKPS